VNILRIFKEYWKIGFGTSKLPRQRFIVLEVFAAIGQEAHFMGEKAKKKGMDNPFPA